MRGQRTTQQELIARVKVISSSLASKYFWGYCLVYFGKKKVLINLISSKI